jgi:hypothetical protein
MIDDFLADFDFNLPLDDASVDPELVFVRRKLAHIARTEGLDGGYYEAQELADAFLAAAREANAGVEEPDSPARLQLGAILDREIPYQRALFEEVSQLPLPDAAAHLSWLTDLMKNRADMFRPVEAARQAQS